MCRVCVYVCVYLCVCVYTQSCLLFCSSMDYSLLGSSVHGIFQTGILERASISYPRGSSPSRDRTHVSCILHWQADPFITSATGNLHNYVWQWMLTRFTVVIISQYTQIFNNYVVHLKPLQCLCQLHLNKQKILSIRLSYLN